MNTIDNTMIIDSFIYVNLRGPQRIIFVYGLQSGIFKKFVSILQKTSYENIH